MCARFVSSPHQYAPPRGLLGPCSSTHWAMYSAMFASCCSRVAIQGLPGSCLSWLSLGALCCLQARGVMPHGPTLMVLPLQARGVFTGTVTLPSVRRPEHTRRAGAHSRCLAWILLLSDPLWHIMAHHAALQPSHGPPMALPWPSVTLCGLAKPTSFDMQCLQAVLSAPLTMIPQPSQ